MSRELTAADALQKARELEQLRYQERLNERIAERERALAQLVADMAKRGLGHSGPRYSAEVEIATKCLEGTIDDQIAIRRGMLQTVPELGSDLELDALLGSINQHIAAFSQVAPQHPLGTVVLAHITPLLSRRRQQDAARLRNMANTKIGILKREVALNMHKEAHQTIITGNAPAIVNLGTIYGSVEQIIGNVGSSGNQELADLMKRLADAINNASDLGEKRAACLEQVRFVAEQAAVPAQERQPNSIVRAVFTGLRAELGDVANVSVILALVGPAIARHFGFAWPF